MMRRIWLFFIAIALMANSSSGASIDFASSSLSAADRAVLACLSVSGGRLQLECATDAVLGMDLAAGQILRADIWQANAGSTGQWRNGAGTAAMSLGPTTTAIQIWGDVDFAGLGTLAVDDVNDYSGAGITATSHLILEAAKYLYAAGIGPRPGGSDIRIFNNLGSAVAQTGASASDFYVATRLIVPAVTSPSGSDLRMYASSGRETKIQEDGGASDALTVTSDGDTALATNATLFLANVHGIAGSTLTISAGDTTGDDVIIKEGAGDGDTARLTIQGASSMQMNSHSGALLQGDNGFYTNVTIANNYGVITDFVRALDPGGLFLQESGGAVRMGVSSAGNYTYSVPLNISRGVIYTAMAEPAAPAASTVHHYVSSVDGLPYYKLPDGSVFPSAVSTNLDEIDAALTADTGDLYMDTGKVLVASGVRALDDTGLALQDQTGAVAATVTTDTVVFDARTYHKGVTQGADLAGYTQLLTELATGDFIGIDDSGDATVIVTYTAP